MNNFLNDNDENLILKENGIFGMEKSKSIFDNLAAVNENCEFDKFDLEGFKNPQLVTHVAKEIFYYLKTIEVTYHS